MKLQKSLTMRSQIDCAQIAGYSRTYPFYRPVIKYKTFVPSHKRKCVARRQSKQKFSTITAAAASDHLHSLLPQTIATLSSSRDIYQALKPLPLSDLMTAAANLRDQAHPLSSKTGGNLMTFSPKVFIPLTKACRDSCGYCTFAQAPIPGKRIYMTLDEVVAVAKLGAEQGCTEALLTLGDKPELKYPEAAAELALMGYSTTIEYLEAAARAVLQTTGLLPHINAGVMERHEMHALRGVSASQGLMIESLLPKLLQEGAPHFNCPDKQPALRLNQLVLAGELKVPFTTGILIGIGETREDRIEAMVAIRDSHLKHGHVQEVIIQNFRAKRGTLMALAPEPPLEELLWTIAVARLILGGEMSIQAPPNLTPERDDANSNDGGKEKKEENSWKMLIDAGINDWGGVSPLTRDFVNPERPWPHILNLAEATASAGKILAPRLPVYPQYLNKDGWLEPAIYAATMKHADVHGLARASSWYAGAASNNLHSDIEEEESSSTGHLDNNNSKEMKRRATPLPRKKKDSWRLTVGTSGLISGAENLKEKDSPSPEIEGLINILVNQDTFNPYSVTQQDIELLFAARGADYSAITTAADELRSRLNGDLVTYVVNRNINYTNICTYGCKFCAFSKGKSNEELRGAPYLLDFSEVSRRAAEAWERGATEVCMQGGIHPDFTGETYLKLVEAAKNGAPSIHVHAFSPLEILHGASTLNMSLSKYLTLLKESGLGSLPGTAAEVLDDTVRAELCPDKLFSTEWLEIIETAHSVGLKTTSTIMFGHIDPVASWAHHLLSLRDVAARTGGISEFVPLPFVHMEAPIFRKGLGARAGPTLRECMLMHSVARLVLYPFINNIQASWVKMGPEKAQLLLSAGCNDMGGVLMNESITRAAGAAHGQELGAVEMESLIKKVGKIPKQRTTLYGEVSEERRGTSLQAGPLLKI